MSSITSESSIVSATENKQKNKKTKTADKADKVDKPKPHILKSSYFETDGTSSAQAPFIEIGIDEAGRGPMFGRVYRSGGFT